MLISEQLAEWFAQGVVEKKRGDTKVYTHLSTSGDLVTIMLYKHYEIARKINGEISIRTELRTQAVYNRLSAIQGVNLSTRWGGATTGEWRLDSLSLSHDWTEVDRINRMRIKHEF